MLGQPEMEKSSADRHAKEANIQKDVDSSSLCGKLYWG